jgi:hypothetical protein
MLLDRKRPIVDGIPAPSMVYDSRREIIAHKKN